MNAKILTLRRLPTLIEIGFWNLAILLLSESLLLQRALGWSFRTRWLKLAELRLDVHFGKALFWAASGLLTGFLIGLARVAYALP